MRRFSVVSIDVGGFPQLHSRMILSHSGQYRGVGRICEKARAFSKNERNCKSMTVSGVRMSNYQTAVASAEAAGLHPINNGPRNRLHRTIGQSWPEEKPMNTDRRNTACRVRIRFIDLLLRSATCSSGASVFCYFVQSSADRSVTNEP